MTEEELRERIQKQADAIQAAVGLSGADLAQFLRRVTLTGKAGSTRDVKSAVRKKIASWAGATDALSRLRFLELCDLVREKAGPTGQHNNLIVRVDLLGVFGIAHEEELFPTPNAFPSITHVIDRPINDEIIGELWKSANPLLLHSSGGMGKTVLMESTAQKLKDTHAVVLFDCFGAGQWRNPADGRHEPSRALLHIANLLAADGLCDILIAPLDETTDLMRAFRKRLVQSVETLRTTDGASNVVLILDAIDHSAIQAMATSTTSFAHLLLESLSISPIAGVYVLASCRTERIEDAIRSAHCRQLPIPKFSLNETADLVQRRDGKATSADISVLYSRSSGNPRVLDGLLRAGRPYESTLETPGSSSVSLDTLIQKQMDDARQAAEVRGVSRQETEALLAGLALLPPPVPAAELAGAHGLSEASVQSFAADLFPLVECTPHGLIFRDEPTETFVRNRFTADRHAIQQIVELLQVRQGESSYAARSLPVVLTELKRSVHD